MLVNPIQSIYSTSNYRQRPLQGCACASFECTRPFNVRVANQFKLLFSARRHPSRRNPRWDGPSQLAKSGRRQSRRNPRLDDPSNLDQSTHQFTTTHRYLKHTTRLPLTSNHRYSQQTRLLYHKAQLDHLNSNHQRYRTKALQTRYSQLQPSNSSITTSILSQIPNRYS